MKALLLGLLITGLHPSAVITGSAHSSDWKLNGDLASTCVLATLGNSSEVNGVQLTVQCDSDTEVTGNIVLKLSVAKLQYKRITITADVESGESNAVLWIKSSRDNKTLLFDSDTEQALFNNTDSTTRRSISAVVAKDATSVSMGLMLHGKGVVTMRNVHVQVSSDGAMSASAQLVLDSALALIKQHNTHSNVDWSVLEANAQQFAAGAQETADVYPVIRYVLQQLGDQRSLVLTPQTSKLLDRHHSNPNTATVKIFALPDGADLVLATIVPVVDQRIADRWP